MGTVIAIMIIVAFLAALTYYVANKNHATNERLDMHVANGDIEPSVIGMFKECEYTLTYRMFDADHKIKVMAVNYEDAKRKFTEETKLPSSAIINPIRVVTDELS